MAEGLRDISIRRPLIYTANQENWNAMADLALQYNCPLVVSAPGDIGLLRSLVKTLTAYGVRDLVLDPGTFVDPGISETLQTFTEIRWAVFREHDDLLGHPLLGIPLTAWLSSEISRNTIAWKEACAASMLITRYADLLILHSTEGWVLLPQLIWRFNIYTDPRKPVSVDPGVREFGTPDKNSPVLVTTNYALTYFTVESDIKAAHVTCYLVVIDTGGISVESAVAGRYLTPDLIANALRDYHVDQLVSHRYVIIPGLASRLSGDTEDASGWKVIVGPKDSSGIAQMILDSWPPERM
jgi:acetyl-CoA decarbonylase/synthase complex subunit gamma